MEGRSSRMGAEDLSHERNERMLHQLRSNQFFLASRVFFAVFCIISLRSRLLLSIFLY